MYNETIPSAIKSTLRARNMQFKMHQKAYPFVEIPIKVFVLNKMNKMSSTKKDKPVKAVLNTPHFIGQVNGSMVEDAKASIANFVIDL